MTPLNRRDPHSTMANATRGRRLALGRLREERMRRVFDGVVASYIRDISVRTAPSADEALS
jgi:uncharacterized DUF497 family protein